MKTKKASNGTPKRRNVATNKLVVNNEATNEAEVLQPEVIEDVKPEEPRAKVTLRVEQMGKHPFAMQFSITQRQKDISVVGLAKKSAYALANGLFETAQDALQARNEHGYYISSFRPKSAFKVYIAIDGVMAFQAIETKGADSIRIMKAGKIVSRALMVQKFSLLASQSKAVQTIIDVFTQEIELEEAIALEQEKLRQIEAKDSLLPVTTN